MQLNKHSAGITDVESWKQARPPKKGDLQWCEGRSAKELAKYITSAYPSVPVEIEDALKMIVASNAKFDWDAEYVTPLPEKGEGRNHDGILYNENIVITIEAKADETLGQIIEEEMKSASVNKLNRIGQLLKLVFKDGFAEYQNLRYQLLTASAGTLLEAMRKNVDTAVMLVLVFKSNGNVSEEKLVSNHQDVVKFLKATNAHEENGLIVIPNNTDVKLYFKEIVI